MKKYREMLSQYKSRLSGLQDTPELQLAWLTKRGYSLPIIICAWREVARFMINGYKFKDSTEIDHKLLTLCQDRVAKLNKLKVTPDLRKSFLDKLRFWK